MEQTASRDIDAARMMRSRAANGNCGCECALDVERRSRTGIGSAAATISCREPSSLPAAYAPSANTIVNGMLPRGQLHRLVRSLRNQNAEFVVCIAALFGLGDKAIAFRKVYA